MVGKNIWLLDNTVLSNFALAAELELLKTYLEIRLRITPQVRDEFQEGIRRKIIPKQSFEWLKITHIKTNAEKRLFHGFSVSLGRGEASSLALAISRRWKLFTDDLDTRRTAQREGVAVSGTIGMLVYLLSKGKIDLGKGNEILWRMIEKGYYSPVRSLS